MVINQSLKIDLQYYTMVLKPAKNIQLCISLFVIQKNPIFNDKPANDNKTLKALIKPKVQPKAMLKGKKQYNILKIKKINQ